MQVPGDPVPVLQYREALGVAAVLGQFERDACLRRERGDHVHRLRGQRHGPRAAAHGEHPADVTGCAERQDDRGSQRHVLPGRGGDPVVVTEIVQDHGLASGQHQAGDRGCDGKHQPQRLAGALPRGMLDDKIAPVRRGHGEGRQVRAGDFQRLLGDLVTSPLARSHRCCLRASSYSRALSTATPAAAASATSSASSSSSNWVSPSFSVR